MSTSGADKTTLVIGASLNPARFSYKAVSLLRSYGIPVRAIGLKPGSIAGVDIDTGTPAYRNIHTVTMYINPKRQPAYYDYILSLSPRRVIFNPGTGNPGFYAILFRHGIEVVENCTLVMLRAGDY